jgi:GNAT superfamily N-acetyltransferase
VAEIEVRPYEPRDRAGVRDVCFRTGYMGDPVEFEWADAESFADIWVGWYVDNEPESAWVAVDGGDVLGYLVGCRDTAAGPNLAWIFVRSVLTRGLLVRPGTAPYLWRSVADLIRDRRLPPVAPDLERWPAHLHIDLLPQARGTGVGTRLMSTWLDKLRDAGVRGVHLGTLAENSGAVAFFEAMGFRSHGPPVAVPGGRTRAGGRLHSLLMVQDL